MLCAVKIPSMDGKLEWVVRRRESEKNRLQLFFSPRWSQKSKRERNSSSGNFWTSIDWNFTFKLESWASKTINSGRTFQCLMHSLCVFFLSSPFPSCPLFFHHHLHRAVVLSGALEKFIQKYPMENLAMHATRQQILPKKVKYTRKLRVRSPLDAISSAATKKITKTKLQIATKKRERKKGHAMQAVEWERKQPKKSKSLL